MLAATPPEDEQKLQEDYLLLERQRSLVPSPPGNMQLPRQESPWSPGFGSCTRPHLYAASVAIILLVF